MVLCCNVSFEQVSHIATMLLLMLTLNILFFKQHFSFSVIQKRKRNNVNKAY